MRIVAAMSGGVDSAVAAALLHEAGHEVVGVTLQLYDHGAAARKRGACCAGQDIHDARDVADRIGIPHYVVDAEARFRSSVIEAFADSYASGETPVPCIRCNQGVKFTDLMALSRELGAEALATGHYVRRVEGADGPELHRPADLSRDQSWFLFATTRAQLGRLRFPLGDFADKAVVRAQAQRLGLSVAEKPDSQDLCFVPDGRYDALVATLRPDAAAPGEIVDARGRVVGRHAGVAGYTVGQGRRLGEAAQLGGERQVVVALDPARRRIVVGPRGAASGSRDVALREVNWLVEPAARLRCEVRLRARDGLRGAEVIAGDDGGAMVVLDEPALAAPGQACVFYAGSRVLGGGFVRRAAAQAGAVAQGAAAS